MDVIWKTNDYTVPPASLLLLLLLILWTKAYGSRDSTYGIFELGGNHYHYTITIIIVTD